MLKKQKIYLLLFILTVILPFIFSLKPIIEGAMPFWNDPARDLLLAWDNLKKPTLIGPTSGIPGIFYGPQWIWILSLGLIFSKDPRWVVLLTITIPYFIIFPYLLWKLSENLFSRIGVIIIWLLFILAYGGYTTQIWSPNLAALFYLIIIYIFSQTDDLLINKKILNFFLLGFFHGLLLNHQISFGVGITFAWIIFFFINFLRCFFDKKKFLTNCVFWIKNLFSFALGFLLIMSPFFIFELRHGFNQTKSLIYTLTQGFIHNQAVVSKIGLTKTEILQKSIEPLTVFLSMPKSLSIVLFVFLTLGSIYYYFISLNKKTNQNRVIFFLFINYLGVLIIYLTTRNPVWSYHFIGFEIVYLFLLGFLMKQNKTLEKIILIWSIILLIGATNSFIKSFQNNKAAPELMTKKNNAEQIYQDAGRDPFVYLAKNPAIYSYDYDYIFRWLSKKYGYKPNNFISDEKLIYLIIPYDMKFDRVGFMENRTPEEKYMTIKEWLNPDGSIIVKRRLKK